jgi:SAM-dependent methyltransferase
MRAAVPVLLGLGAVCRRLFHFQDPCDLGTAEVEQDHFDLARRNAEGFLARLPLVADRDVLDLGCGHGGMLEALGERGARAVGLDPDESRVAFAQERGLRAVTGTAENMPFPAESFDLIVSDSVLEHLHDIDRVLEEAARVLRPGGELVATWGPAWLTYNGPHLIKCLSVPWVQLLFSDKTIVAALRRQRQSGRWPESYLDYKIDDFLTMGRLTRRKLRRAARRAGLEIVEETSRSSRRLKDTLAKVPPFDELLAGELFVRLRRS